MKSSILLALLLIIVCPLLSAQTYKVLWNFNEASDGAYPVSGLTSDGMGNLYGTTQYGGSAGPCAVGCGTIFELSPNADGSWSESVLYDFCSDFENGLCLDGQWPASGIVFDRAGNLYGTTTYGGSGSCGTLCGTVFELSPSSFPGEIWTETVLYSFCSGANNQCQDGGKPSSELIFDTTGNLYGTTTLGGTGNGGFGTAFELSPGSNGWTHTTLYSFCSTGHARICPDGAEPAAGVTFDKMGNLYGTTEIGGTNNSEGNGTIFRLTPGSNGWTHTIAFTFSPGGRGLGAPLGSVSYDPQGNLYTTTSLGNPGGGILQLQPKTQTQRNFVFNVKDGSGPASGVFVDAKRNAIYGTTVSGGSGTVGVVYKIVSSGNETVLYNFCQQTGCSDGELPYAGVIEDKSGNLYGTTQQGGTYGQGVVFEITP